MSAEHRGRRGHAASLAALVLASAVALAGCADPDGETPAPGTAALLDPELAGGFLSFPWPSNSRRTAAGAPDLEPLPNPGGTELIEDYREAALELVRGFGTYPLMHVRFDADLDPAGFPTTAQTMGPSSPVQLMAIDPESPVYLQLVPLQLHWQAGDRVFVEGRTLSALPAVGFPLRPATRYALVVLDTLGDAQGEALLVPESLQAWMAGRGPEELVAHYVPLAAALRAAGVDPASVAAATVFTTQEPTAELHAMRGFVTDPTWLDVPQITSFGVAASWEDDPDLMVYEGTYLTPVFQRGEPPYASEGGGFEWSDGAPVIQRFEAVTFSVATPRDAGQGVFPLVLFLPGTGGTIYDHLDPDEPYPPARLLAARGIATVSFEPPLHGSRGAGAEPDLHTFNYFNPESARCVLRQEALDASVMIRVLREVLVAQHPELQLDVSRLGFFGHSQGAHTGTLLAAVEPEFDPLVINGMGGGLCYTVIERKDPLDIEAAVRLGTGETDEPLTVFHPIIGLVQLLADAVDPLNYGPEWFLRADHGTGTSVLHTAGYLDHATPPVTVNGLSVAAGVPAVVPLEWDIPEAALIDLYTEVPPYSDNVMSGYGELHTAGLITRADHGHYTIWDDEDVATAAAEFLRTGLFNDQPWIYETE